MYTWWLFDLNTWCSELVFSYLCFMFLSYSRKSLKLFLVFPLKLVSKQSNLVKLFITEFDVSARKWSL